MKIPDIEHLRYLILHSLLDGRKSGQFIRDRLAKFNHRKTRPAFYMLMGRIEADKLVKQIDNASDIPGATFRSTIYELTPAGRQKMREVEWFYAALNSGKTV